MELVNPHQTPVYVLDELFNWRGRPQSPLEPICILEFLLFVRNSHVVVVLAGNLAFDWWTIKLICIDVMNL